MSVDLVGEDLVGGLIPVTIDAVGIGCDVEAPSVQGYPGYQFLLDDPLCCPPRRIEGEVERYLAAHPLAVGAVVMQIARDCLRMTDLDGQAVLGARSAA